MKKMIKIWISAITILALQSQFSFAQKINEERMKRDIEVAENVLSTLIKHEINSQRTFFGLDINGAYQEGYGVTFRLPGNYTMPLVISGDHGQGAFIYRYSDDMNSPTVSFRRDNEVIEAPEPPGAAVNEERSALTLGETTHENRKAKTDSVRNEYNNKLISAAKDFILDYGDMISQLGAEERIVVTNQGENRSWYFKENKRTHLSVEGKKSDITAFKEGKLNRAQALAKLKVVNTESVDIIEPDMELLSSIFNRLYRDDLSKTYFAESNLYYERLKDYGVIYYMQVYSSKNVNTYGDSRLHNLPTIGLQEVDQATRDKKVTELYPKFEQDLKENMLEYGRTLKTLGDDELLVFNVTITKCDGCGIPSSLELSVKGSVLKDFGSGKLDKAAGTTRFTVKKGPRQ